MIEQENKVNIAFVGHVDHGKSSILGRLLVETNSLPDGKLEQVKAYCQSNAKDFEYAYLIDSLEKEQSQGITIDAARYFIRSGQRKFLFIDTPGHLDFIKNMMTGSATADIALLIVDAKEGIKENTLRHIYLLSFLQIHQIVVLINKMDQVDYAESIFTTLSESILKVFRSHQLTPAAILPICAKYGDNFTTASPKMGWYRGPTLWQSLCNYSLPDEKTGGEFRMPLQDIYRFSKEKDDRRIYAGTVTSGMLKKGDRILFSPSQKEGVVQSIESEQAESTAGFAAGFTLEAPLFVERGELLSKVGATPPIVGDRIKVRLFWMSRQPLVEKKRYTLRVHTSKVACTVEQIVAIHDSATLEMKNEIHTYDIVECILSTVKPIAFDLSPSLIDTNRFVLVDQHEMICAGNIQERIALNSDRQIRWALCETGQELLLKRALQERGHKAFTLQIEGTSEVYLAKLEVALELGSIALVQVDSPAIEERLKSHFKEVSFRKGKNVDALLQELLS